MDIGKRIELVMSQEGLFAKEFSEQLGVQRSSISHLITGRNKPSIDFIQKFIKVFPSYNIVWLISGEGAMKLEPKVIQNNETKTTNKVIQHSLFESDEIKKPINIEKTIDTQNVNIPFDKPKESKTTAETENKLNETKIENKPSDIERIVIFFRDGTFKTYSEMPKI
ncbi:MAG: helix-turn-helix transcriptional regulator [Salinivirgaceae bacterium]|nr:helix-turn-helix transcriptional regulator [Salinivirgaceae bacterium]MDD4745674.1 helix-turn-helix transcriptional regulator [Salinivirgaceae bacterium]MDY0280925.1 helix-turn-helix transcriptional regulator [Salinivirgaceae bacterium]